MIESNNPEIDVDELMHKIREEVAQRNNKTQPSLFVNSNNTVKINFNFNYLEALLRNAEARADVRTKWPDKLNRFPFTLSGKIKKYCLKIVNFIFKDQREVNLNLINALKQSTLLNRQLVTEVELLRSQFNQHLDSVENRINNVDSQVKVFDERFNQINNQTKVFDERFNQINNQTKVFDERFNQIDNQTKVLDERLNQVDNQVINQVDSQAKALDERLNYLNSRIQELNGSYIQNDCYIKNDLVQQKRLLIMFLEEARKRLPEPFNEEQLGNLLNEEKHLSDAFYVAFEEKFRGSREDIFNRLKIYLPLIEQAKVGTSDSAILDVGCGRGEWLELLGESGYTARGLDINRVMIEQCLSRGFEVIESDVISYLQSLEDNSLGAITGFHIIEHLPFETLMTLFAEAIRVIKPGGLVIFETPNPENILVGSCNFYIDPTHRNPLPSSTIEFLAESQGLERVKIIKLHPYSDISIPSDSDLAERFNEYFYGAQDYAVIGYKK